MVIHVIVAAILHEMKLHMLQTCIYNQCVSVYRTFISGFVVFISDVFSGSSMINSYHPMAFSSLDSFQPRKYMAVP